MSGIGGGLHDRSPQPPGHDNWRLTWYETVFFGALTLLWLMLLFNAPLMALVLAWTLGVFWAGIYVGWHGKSNHDFERYLGRWLT
jgi:hypothetical protein